MKAFGIPILSESLKRRFQKGEITLYEAARKFYLAGWHPYVDVESTKKLLMDGNEDKEVSENEQEIAISIADRFIYIQVCDDGFDYSIYDETYRLLDGGMYDNLEKSITDTLKEILEDLILNERICGKVSRNSAVSLLNSEEFRESVAETESRQIEEYLQVLKEEGNE